MSIFKDSIIITNRHLCNGDFLLQLKTLAKESPFAIVLREKDLSLPEYVRLAAKVSDICRQYNIQFIAHSHANIGEYISVDALHLPLPKLLQTSSRELSLYKTIGTSVHSIEEAELALSYGAGYLIVSNIYETPCKPGVAGKGVELIRNVRSATDIPIYALGGITAENASLVMYAGATTVCYMSSAMKR